MITSVLAVTVDEVMVPTSILKLLVKKLIATTPFFCVVKMSSKLAMVASY